MVPKPDDKVIVYKYQIPKEFLDVWGFYIERLKDRYGFTEDDIIEVLPFVDFVGMFIRKSQQKDILPNPYNLNEKVKYHYGTYFVTTLNNMNIMWDCFVDGFIRMEHMFNPNFLENIYSGHSDDEMEEFEIFMNMAWHVLVSGLYELSNAIKHNTWNGLHKDLYLWYYDAQVFVFILPLSPIESTDVVFNQTLE